MQKIAIFLVSVLAAQATTCADGEYWDHINTQWKPCDSLCTTCSWRYEDNNSTYGASTYNCLTCADPTRVIYQGTWHGTCPSTDWTGCVSPCERCTTDPSTCSACVAPKLLYGNSCVDTCPTATYSDGTECLACIANCDACIDGSTCDTCTTGWYLHNSVCFNPCPNQTFPESTVCTSWESTCETCTRVTACVTCPTGDYLHNSFCVNPCPDLTYPDAGTLACESCQTSCQTWENASNCLTCPTGHFMNNSLCVTTCPDQTYPVTGVCQACESSCQTCTNATTCATCPTGDFMHIPVCVNPCPDMTFPDTSTSACEAWESSCQTCNNASTCLTCPTGDFMHASLCVNLCPDGTFQETSTSTCEAWLAACLTCTKATTCASCRPGDYMNNSTCVTTCPTGTFPDTSVCTNWESSCETCADAIQCLTCPTGDFMHSSLCVNPCPDQYFPDTSTSTCEAWESSCQTCANATTCSTCPNGEYLHLSLCVTTCPTGYYPDSSQCHVCITNCTDCSNGVSCITCDTGFWGATCDPPACGDSFLQNWEQCDDSNLVNWDGCDSNCIIETETCPHPTVISATMTLSQLRIEFSLDIKELQHIYACQLLVNAENIIGKNASCYIADSSLIVVLGSDAYAEPNDSITIASGYLSRWDCDLTTGYDVMISVIPQFEISPKEGIALQTLHTFRAIGGFKYFFSHEDFRCFLESDKVSQFVPIGDWQKTPQAVQELPHGLIEDDGKVRVKVLIDDGTTMHEIVLEVISRPLVLNDKFAEAAVRLDQANLVDKLYMIHLMSTLLVYTDVHLNEGQFCSCLNGGECVNEVWQCPSGYIGSNWAYTHQEYIQDEALVTYLISEIPEAVAAQTPGLELDYTISCILVQLSRSIDVMSFYSTVSILEIITSRIALTPTDLYYDFPNCSKVLEVEISQAAVQNYITVLCSVLERFDQDYNGQLVSEEHLAYGKVYYAQMRSTLEKLVMSLTLVLGVNEEYTLKAVNIRVYIKSFEDHAVEMGESLPSVVAEDPIKTYVGYAVVSRGRVEFEAPISGNYYLQVIEMGQSPYGWSEAMTTNIQEPSGVSSSVLSVNLIQRGSTCVPAVIEGTQIKITIPIDSLDPLTTLECVYWSGDTWNTEGIQTDDRTALEETEYKTRIDTQTCVSSHLSSFSVVPARETSYSTVQSNTQNYSESPEFNWWIWWFVIGVIIMQIILTTYGYYKDRRDERTRPRNERSESSIELVGIKPKAPSLVCSVIKNCHNFFSIFTRYDPMLSRPYRASIFTVRILVLMSVSALFYKGDASTQDIGIERQVSNRIGWALVTAVTVIPISFLLTKLIKLSPDKKDSDVSSDAQANLQKAKNETPNSKFVDSDEVDEVEGKDTSVVSATPIISNFTSKRSSKLGSNRSSKKDLDETVSPFSFPKKNSNGGSAGDSIEEIDLTLNESSIGLSTGSPKGISFPIHAFVDHRSGGSHTNLDIVVESVASQTARHVPMPRQIEIVPTRQKVKRSIGIILGFILWVGGLYLVYSFGAYFGETVAFQWAETFGLSIAIDNIIYQNIVIVLQLGLYRIIHHCSIVRAGSFWLFSKYMREAVAESFNYRN